MPSGNFQSIWYHPIFLWLKSGNGLLIWFAGSSIRRWGAEECYRFEKQGFGIEKATVRRYRSIRTLLGLTLLSWLALIKINENKKLRHEGSKAAKPPLLPFFPKPISSLFELEYAL